MCDYLTRTNHASKFELYKNCNRLTNYLDRFKNHVGTILNEPEATIDVPFKNDLAARTDA